MKNILMITNIFPCPSLKLLNNTSVCFYFAKEWIKLGYKVNVIYNYTVYLPVLHWIACLFEERIANYFPTVINRKSYSKPFTYTLDGIVVDLIPCYKVFPKLPFSRKTIKKQVNLIKKKNEERGWTPDVVIGHFLHPSLEIISELKSIYSVPVGLVLHGEVTMKDASLIRKCDEGPNCIDFWGFRSNPIRKAFENNYKVVDQSFMCFSGVPEKFLRKEAFDKFNGSSSVSKFVYVGNLIKRKHPLPIIRALNAVYDDDPYTLSYLGSGGEMDKLVEEVGKLGVEEKVHFLGRKSREEVADYLLKSECFIMISESETFGLVYLEAMANGCITVASRDEGMDGIIIDGFNGFLCEAGNYVELCSILKKIKSLPLEDRIKISKNAIQTAFELTDVKVAKKYINSVELFEKI